MVVPREVFFDSAGVRCAADLYWPDAVTGSVACVVMGHGGSGTKRLRLPKYAKVFAAAGLAVLAFDYRRFGNSGGLPRQVIEVAGQREDYRAAVRFARSLDGTDPRRIALWGTSLSGSHVLAVAACLGAVDRWLASRACASPASELGRDLSHRPVHRRRGP